MAFDFVLRTNLFNYDDLLTISPVSFSSWYKCINDTSLLNEFMTRARELFYHAPVEQDTYIECMNDYSLDFFACKHWTDDDDHCDAVMIMRPVYVVFMTVLVYMMT